jgi:peptide/nickel transport system permease protein
MADESAAIPTTATLRLSRRSVPGHLRAALSLNVSTYVGIGLVGIPLCAALLAPFLTSADPMALSAQTLRAPTLAHLMGTDDLGRDVFARVLYGGRISLMVGLFSALIAITIGTAVGLVAGYFEGRTDEILMRITEIFQIIPRFLLAIVVVALLGGGIVKIIAIIGILGWVGTARVVRAQLLVLRREEFVLAATLGGASSLRIIMRHILPNVVPFIIVSASLQTGGAILTESFLSFLGLGDPSRPSWGLLLQHAQLHLQQAWWMSTFPGIALSVTILGLNLVGDGLASKFGARKIAR